MWFVYVWGTNHLRNHARAKPIKVHLKVLHTQRRRASMCGKASPPDSMQRPRRWLIRITQEVSRPNEFCSQETLSWCPPHRCALPQEQGPLPVATLSSFHNWRPPAALGTLTGKNYKTMQWQRKTWCENANRTEVTPSSTHVSFPSLPRHSIAGDDVPCYAAQIHLI